MTNTINGFDLTFVNLSNAALAAQRQDELEWQEARDAGVRAVMQSRKRRAERLKARKWDKLMTFCEALCVITCMLLLMIDWG